MARDYSKTVMYKLVCKDTNVSEIYVGHTTNVKKRRSHHMDNSKYINRKNYNLKVYQYIRENGGWNNWDMIIFEDYPCNDIFEATKREGYWIKELQANLNCKIAGRTKSEWQKENRENNKEKEKEKKKQYYEKIKEKTKEKVICKCGCEILKCCLKKHMTTPKHFTFLQSIQSPSF
jgi:hypothetical protein